MEFQDLGEEFVAEDVETVIKNAVGVVLKGAAYNPGKVDDWSNSIMAAVLKGLQSLNRPYKYCISVIIMQKNGAGLVSSASTYWDAVKDGLCKVTWENGSMHCVVTVFGSSVNVDSPAELDEL